MSSEHINADKCARCRSTNTPLQESRNRGRAQKICKNTKACRLRQKKAQKNRK